MQCWGYDQADKADTMTACCGTEQQIGPDAGQQYKLFSKKSCIKADYGLHKHSCDKGSSCVEPTRSVSRPSSIRGCKQVAVGLHSVFAVCLGTGATGGLSAGF